MQSSSATNDDGPLGPLPGISSRQARFDSRLHRINLGDGPRQALEWLSGPLGRSGLAYDRPEVYWRPSGLRRTGMVAQLSWPSQATKLAIGLETPLAHGLVDRLLGFDRLPAEERLPISPVEWGILTFVVAETLRRLANATALPLTPYDLTIDRLGPDPFDVNGLGRVVTIAWPIRLGDASGSVRLWLTESLANRWLAAETSTRAPSSSAPPKNADELAATWRAEAGAVALPRGIRTLRTGGVLPIVDTRLRGQPRSPSGPVDLALTLADREGRFVIQAEPLPHSGGGRLTITSPCRHIRTPREALPMSSPTPTTPSDPTAAMDVPVTLVVELGRLNLSLARLADLKPGDVVELGRHSREPVELTSGGRLVARGELVQIDTELGVRILHVFL